MAMAAVLATTSHFVAMAAMLLLAGWLLWLNFRSPVNRSFALFLALRAAVTFTTRMKVFADQAGDEAAALFWEGMRGYYYLALAPTLVYFWLAYAGVRRRGVWLAVILLLAGSMQFAYLSDHCLASCSMADGRPSVGPLSLLENPGYLLVMGLAGLWVLREALDRKASPRGRAALPVALGLLLGPLLEGTIVVGFLLHFGGDVVIASYSGGAWVPAYHVAFLLVLVPPLTGVAWVAAWARSDPAWRSRALVFGGLAALCGASGIYVGWIPATPAAHLFSIFLLGAWRILLPAVVAYALVRHRLFGVDVRLRWALVRATMALAFLGVFFVGAQLAQNYLSARYGWGLGGVAAGLLLFTINPLQGLAERFGRAVLPNATPVSAMPHPERLQLFRNQAALVWSDGTMGRKERAMLDALRERLGIPLEQAVRIEAEAARAPAS